MEIKFGQKIYERETDRQKDRNTSIAIDLQRRSRGINIQTEKGGKTKIYKHIMK
jgi:hypothetical protein